MEDLENLINEIAAENEAGANTKERVATVLQLVKDKIASATSYDIEETLTGGTWIDGKPIYRKTKVFSNADLAGLGDELDYSAFFPDLETAIDTKYIADFTGTGGFVSNGDSYAYNITFINKFSDKIINYNSQLGLTLADIVSLTLTIDYTKTL